ncbi:MAG: FIST N-terminal domain-containing protein [Paracoccaceae bacterium]
MIDPVTTRAEAPANAPDRVRTLLDGLGPGPHALVIVFATPQVAPEPLLAALAEALPGVPLIGCTTAGEITRTGYAEGMIVAMAVSARNFAANVKLIEDLGHLDSNDVVNDLIRRRRELASAAPDLDNEFAFLLVDGLSTKEDELAATLAPGLGATPLFGGSAADGDRFLETRVFHGARALRNAAVVAVLRTDCPIRVFKFDHFRPTATRMVVTRADPSRRIVQQINAEPAAQEFARILGKDPAQLTPFTFAAHPVVVRIGGRHHVRSIRQVDDNGDLIFFSAIDEGLVLTLAESEDMERHLRAQFAQLSLPGQPAAILACDCMLRRTEAEEKQQGGRISSLLAEAGVIGFSTYGEQFNGMHVNQTMTGVAIYPPRGRA